MPAAAIETALVVVARRNVKRLCDCVAASAPQALETVASVALAAAFVISERLDVARAVYIRVIEIVFTLCFFFASE